MGKTETLKIYNNFFFFFFLDWGTSSGLELAQTIIHSHSIWSLKKAGISSQIWLVVSSLYRKRRRRKKKTQDSRGTAGDQSDNTVWIFKIIGISFYGVNNECNHEASTLAYFLYSHIYIRMTWNQTSYLIYWGVALLKKKTHPWFCFIGSAAVGRRSRMQPSTGLQSPAYGPWWDRCG